MDTPPPLDDVPTVKPNFAKRGGLIVVIIQDWQTNEVLMQAFMNDAAWEMTLKYRELVYFSTSKDRLVHKGEEGGNRMAVKDILLDCDLDAAVMKVEVLGEGLACHLHQRTCFSNKVK